mmetsp:Transcript_10994/g.22417  ORF Transcript_10994/g.22417 Transcript_10994/m.22417 type:complete len:341 (-) Transcript_10994:23-1045(-)
MDQLKAKTKEQQSTIAELQKVLKDKEAVSDKALAAYKRKAQTSLAEANARAAAANQAREEAELDAASARSAVEDAMERARVAESSKADAVSKAESEVHAMEAKLEEQSSDVSDLREELESTKERFDELEGEARNVSEECHRLKDDVDNLTRELDAEREKCSTIEYSYKNEQIKSQGYSDEVDTLREELQRTAKAAMLEREQNGNTDKAGGKKRMSAHEDGAEGAMSEANATIIMLQQELSGANDAIRELKEALRNAFLKNDGRSVAATEATSASELQAKSFDSGDASHASPPTSIADPGASTTTGPSTGQSDATPLFFAMEKQFELNTAHDEILRLPQLP